MSNEEKNAVSEITGLIPEVYFDVISRFVPGAILLMLVYRMKPDILGTSDFSLGHMLLGIILAYGLGLILDCFTNFLTGRGTIWYSWRVFTRVVDNLNADKDRIAILEFLGTTCDKWQQLPSGRRKVALDQLREHVRVNLDYARRLVTKLHAEERMLKNLSTGLILGGLLLLYGWDVNWWEPRAEQVLKLLGVLVFVEILLFLGIRDRISRVVARTVHWFFNIQGSDSPKK